MQVCSLIKLVGRVSASAKCNKITLTAQRQKHHVFNNVLTQQQVTNECHSIIERDRELLYSPASKQIKEALCCYWILLH